MEMLSEDRSLSESSQWRKVKGGMERDPRYRAVLGGTTQREEWFKEYIKSLATATSSGSKVGVQLRNWSKRGDIHCIHYKGSQN